ncbi:bifunctional phosphopantothenoylcysteine decarboxylase/phosphopantothenate--cysteine ligase CoaBC [uncultured Alistipes sp.]|jgi:phosphopantothenoylcysteine decarboxylase/phosphopantothenate--cysteine ligase|uniref:bifunctional phosphopantothenoylcysteine decarboxylase/phosphopantothenate--cysteine ligase CoaBC n=1 Tax=uncultured Alistipes sp. TaxID=538949 RepID=UPI000E8A5B53|nr:bifunctional phosphopantothenoylcysteine decarboxylase/phosphopantothenate--cysteine ligase CoaBC [uncultured Alistipes sp.]HBL70698.1 bifunctional phosphopantothenoylcysteine decarboxylase/phosphopantothenate--cysteine ligase CoaBC [Alistipes sp.]HBW00917.1 bifunctional phosphopantothenoylcysteine decarboxylase/phosphopantothenate--cysteine ligase CoaBC [Alistipes sp.]
MASDATTRRPLDGRRILLGITGSIAAYKAAVLCRLLKTAGADVRVVMTPLAKQFITPLTMATLSKNPILVEFFDPENGAWNSHVALGEWADCYLIAPATANTLAKMATGVADNLLLTTYLSARCPVVVAPAMDLDMYAHEATQQNLRTLAARGVRIVEPEEGELASGLQGKGRMAEPDRIAAFVGGLLDEKKKTLAGKRLIVTAGATIEAIDPVRFISNHSSGKMGYAIAGELAARGAAVTLVTGRTSLPTPAGVERVDVLSAAEMYEAAVGAFDASDGAVMCAAVADYTPAHVSDTKIKKGDGGLTIELRRTRDIAAELGARKGGRVLVGFALETDDEEAHAEAKLTKKNFDFIVLNSLRDPGAGFRGDTNKVTLIDRAGREELPLMSKREVAARIADKLETILK